MKKLSLSLFLIALCFVALAQNKRILEADSTYKAVLSMIDEGYLTPAGSSVSVNRPAIGMQNTTLDFYWNDMESENWGEDANGEMEIQVNRKLYMASTFYNVAASSLVRINYIYDGKGQLLMCFRHETTMETIYHQILYFNTNQLKRSVVRNYSVNDEGTEGELQLEEITDKEFPKDILQMSGRALQQSASLQKYFDDLFRIEAYDEIYFGQ